MDRLAVFVEGYTEVLFVDKLIEEIAGRGNVLIEHRKIWGGSKTRRRTRVVRAAKLDTGQKYYVLIIDCGGDDQVKDRILEEHENFTRKGYLRIIGLRDVRPDFTYQDIPRLEANLPRKVKTSLIPVQFILSIMEIEAWFLAETTHYPKIHPSITVQAIRARLGFDPENDDIERRDAPADDLNNCYAIGGKTYLKHKANDTVQALDYTLIYMELCNKFNYLRQLITSIETFLN